MYFQPVGRLVALLVLVEVVEVVEAELEMVLVLEVAAPNLYTSNLFDPPQ